MTNYMEVSVGITPFQRKSFARAVQSGSSVKLKLTYNQLVHHNVTLHVTRTQYKRIGKAISEHKGLMLNISNKQLSQMKKGGLLGNILGALVGSLAPILFQKVFPDNSQQGSGYIDPISRSIAKNAFINENNNRALKGLPPVTAPQFADGMNMPGTGLNMPGSGINMPRGRGINTNAVTSNNGEGSMYHLAGNHTSFLPDSYANVPSKTRPLLQKNFPRGRGLSTGPGYMDPHSEKFQMLK